MDVKRAWAWMIVVLGGVAACSGSHGAAAPVDGGGGIDAPGSVSADAADDQRTNVDGATVPFMCGLTTAACGLANVTPTEVAPSLVALTATHLYYRPAGVATRPRLSRIPVGGATVEVLLDGSEGQGLGAVVVDDGGATAYFVLENISARAGTLMRIPLTATAPIPPSMPVVVDTTATEPSVDNIGDIVLAGGKLFFSVSFRFSARVVSAGGLNVLPLSGGPPTPVLAATGGRGLRVHGGYLYFSGLEVEGTGSAAALVRVPTGGGAAEVLLVGGQDKVPMTFEVSDAGIYWVAGGVMNLPLTGGTPRMLFAASPSQDPIAIVNPRLGLDANAAYVGLQFLSVTAQPLGVGSQLLRVPFDGGAAKTIFETKDAFDMDRIAVAGTWVYFSFPATPGLARVDGCGCTGH